MNKALLTYRCRVFPNVLGMNYEMSKRLPSFSHELSIILYSSRLITEYPDGYVHANQFSYVIQINTFLKYMYLLTHCQFTHICYFKVLLSQVFISC